MTIFTKTEFLPHEQSEIEKKYHFFACFALNESEYFVGVTNWYEAKNTELLAGDFACKSKGGEGNT